MSTYTDETRAAVMAALLAGQSVSSVAKEYEIPKGTVSRWRKKAIEEVGSASNGPKKETGGIGERLTHYLEKNLEALAAQAEVFADPEWLMKQPASDAAVLHGVMTDKAVRLIEAFGRAEGESDGD